MSVRLVWGNIVWKIIGLHILIFLIQTLAMGYFVVVTSVLYIALWFFGSFKTGSNLVRLIRNGLSPGQFIVNLISFTFCVCVLVFFSWANVGSLPIATWITSVPEELEIELLRSNLIDVLELDNPGAQALASFGKAIGSKRVVALGESSHFTAEYPTLKIQLIKYLHQELGFDVLLFEGPGLPLEGALEEMYQHDLDPAFGIKGMIKYWSAEEMLPLIEYVLETQKTERPLQLIGFDRQNLGLPIHGTLNGALDFLSASVALLDSAVAQKYLTNVAKWPEIMGARQKNDPSDPQVIEAVAYFEELSKQFYAFLDSGHDYGPDKVRQLIIAAQATRGMAEDIVSRSMTQLDFNLSRDKRMAQNIIELSETIFSDDRLIIYAHNVHLHKYPSRQKINKNDFFTILNMLGNDGKPPAPNLGNHLVRYFEDDLHVVGFLTAGGHAGNPFWFKKRTNVRYPRRDSIEYILQPDGVPAVFLDFSSVGNNIDEVELYLRYMNVAWVKVLLRDQFDSVFVLDRISPSTPIN